MHCAAERVAIEFLRPGGHSCTVGQMERVDIQWGRTRRRVDRERDAQTDKPTDRQADRRTGGQAAAERQIKRC